MNQQDRRFYEFGSFRLDLAEKKLLRDGQALAMTPKVFETLLALIENKGRTIEKKELMERVWPESFVEEANLTQNISVLRKTLGENSGTPHFIETVPTRGYRFIAEVHERWEEFPVLVVEERSITNVTIKPQNGVSGGTGGALQVGNNRQLATWLRQYKTLSYSLFGVTLVSAGLAIWLAGRNSVRKEFDPGQLRFVELTALKSRDGKSLAAGRFSPDGKVVALVAPGEGSNLWVMQVGGSSPIRITEGNWRDWSPVWSPDGQSLAFVSNRGGQIGIWKSPFLGGPAKLIETLGEDELDLKGGPPSLVAWSKDGRYIYYEWSHKLFRLELDSSLQTSPPLIVFESSSAIEFSLSSDEKQIAFVDKKGGQFDVWRAALSSGELTRVTNDRTIDQRPIWHPDGQRLLYSSLREGRTQIFMTEVNGGQALAVTSGEHNGAATDIAPDGASLICQRVRVECDLFAVSAGGEERQVSVDWGVEFWPSISPDGATIAFQFIHGEQFIWEPEQGALLAKPLWTESRPMELAADAFSAQWAPDGKRLAFLRRSDRQIRLWTVPAVGGQEKLLTPDGILYGYYTFGPTYNRVQAADFCWSPDGSQIVYCAKKDGAANVWTVAADGSEHTRLSANTDPSLRLNCPLWAPDGKRVAYVVEHNATTLGQKQVWELWITGQQSPVFRTEMRMRLLGWSGKDELSVALVENKDLNLTLPSEVTLVTLAAADGREALPRRSLPETYLCSIRLLPNQRNVSLVMAQRSVDNLAILLPGGEIKQLTDNRDEKLYFSSPVWSPSGETIYFTKQTKWELLSIISNFN